MYYSKMEATIYEDQSFLLANKNSYAQDNGKLWLNLANEYKSTGRRDEFDISDLLRSPDIGISSPDLETIVWRNFPDNCGVKLQSVSSPPPLFVPQEDYTTQQVTAEQEVFARGFTDALQRLREEREVCQLRAIETPTSDESNKVAVDDSKCTFISYRFDSSYRLPSFQETFSPAKSTGTIKTKTTQDIDRTYYERECEQQLEGSEISEWFKVETLEEGFSGQQQCSYKDCLLNSPGEDSDDYSTNSPSLQSPSSDFTAQDYHYGDFESDNKVPEDMEFQNSMHGEDEFEADGEWSHDRRHTIQDTPTPKHWLTVHTKLYNMSVLKQEVDTLEEQTQVAIMPENIDVQGFIKTERKRRKNRLAAWKCRQKKLIRESRLETTVEELCMENSRLMEELEKLKRKRQQLEQTFIKHVTSGCEEAHVQYTETFNGDS